MEQKQGKQMLPPPEMFVTIEDLYNFNWNLFKTQMDLEIVRRIIWKLVMNSMQATTEGLVSISISRKSARESKELGSLTERLQIVVTDTGKGMEQKFVEGARMNSLAVQRRVLMLTVSLPCRAIVPAIRKGGRGKRRRGSVADHLPASGCSAIWSTYS